MSDAKHTPGPWWVYTIDDEWNGIHSRGIVSAQGGLNKGETYELFSEADARLIAVAPDMIGLLYSWRAVMQEPRPHDAEAIIKNILKDTIETIAKAEGKA